MTKAEVLAIFNMSAVNFYKCKINKVLDSWDLGNSLLYSTEQVNFFKYWLFVRKGLQALGISRPMDQ